jgi:hypothetical protein
MPNRPPQHKKYEILEKIFPYNDEYDVMTKVQVSRKGQERVLSSKLVKREPVAKDE